MRTDIKSKILLLLNVFLAFTALQHDTFLLVGREYEVDIPILKYIFAIMELLSGWGIQNIVLFVGIAMILWHTQKETKMQKNIYLSILSGIFAVSTVVGISYSDLGSWNYIFDSVIQFIASVIVAAGYFVIYKNLIISAYRLLLKCHEKSGKYEILIFEKHPFIAPLIIFAAVSLPYIIIFFPGVIEWDAIAQLNTYYNGIMGSVAHHPIVSTMLLGKSMTIGKVIFHNDNMGIFIYTCSQYCFQWLVFSYCIFVISKIKCRFTAVLRWLSLTYLALFPLFQIWGFMLCKDAVYYMSVLLLMTSVFHIILSGKHSVWWQCLLAAVGVAGMAFFRNDGIYLIVFFVVLGLILNRKYFKIYLFCLLTGVFAYLLVTAFYMPKLDVEKGPIREALSIPLQQTARYILEHENEITEDEAKILEIAFGGVGAHCLKFTTLKYLTLSKKNLYMNLQVRK